MSVLNVLRSSPRAAGSAPRFGRIVLAGLLLVGIGSGAAMVRAESDPAGASKPAKTETPAKAEKPTPPGNKEAKSEAGTSPAPPGTVILSPRSRAEYEADLKALEQKYGFKDGSGTKAQVIVEQGASSEPVPAAPGQRNASAGSASARLPPAAGGTAAPATSVLRTAPAGAQRIRIQLLPVDERQFSLDGERYDAVTLRQRLIELSGQYQLDSLLLLETPGQPVGLGHVVELTKLAEAVRLPALYQQNGVWHAVGTAAR